MKIFYKTLIMLLLFSVICPVTFRAQDASPIYKVKSTEIDPSTGDLKVTTEKLKIGENEDQDSVMVYFMKRRIKGPATIYKYYLSISSNLDLGCAGASENYVKLLLEKGDKIKLDKDMSKMNCNKPVESIYELNENYLERLKSANVVSIMLKQSKYYSEFNISQPECFKKSIRILGNYK